ncbi:MAG: hypothetical protein ACI9UT_002866 [Flavobacteriales bacterium]|jgi:hypothetical protein
MKKLVLFIGVLLSSFLAGCGNDSRHDLNVLAPVSAPITILGKSIKGTITSGDGGFASSGRSTFVASSTDNTYKVIGDGIHTINSKGTFSYNASNKKATLAFDDSILGKGNYHFTFTSKTTGTYMADSEQNSKAKQTGSFEIF